MGSFFSIPTSVHNREELMAYLQKTVTNLEIFVKSIKDSPSTSQRQYFQSVEYEFKSTYKILVQGNSTNSELESIMTRFGRIQVIWNKLVNPQSYNYLEEPLLNK